MRLPHALAVALLAAAQLPAQPDFSDPFVEKVRLIREWDGEAANDQFGWIARPVGDIDRDGVTDIVTSAPGTPDRSGRPPGRVYVYSSKTGALLWKVDGRPGDSLGIGVEGAGDTNGDGVPDVVASAPGSGHAYIYSGKDGHVLQTFTGTAAEFFGRHVAGVGDVNRDGCADVMVGAPGAAGQPSASPPDNPGHAYVYSGKDGRRLLTLKGERKGDRFGSAVAGATGRGPILLVGAPDAGPERHGRVYVYTRLSTRPAFTIDPEPSGRALGEMFLSVVGDVDGDGTPDVYASDFSDAARGENTGRIYVHSGKDGHRLFTRTGETPGEGFGIGPAAAGDVNGDGHADLIVGAWQYHATAASAGRAYVLSGKDARLMRTITGKIAGETFGFDAVGIGDVDGDGTIDLLLTSAWSGIHGQHSGRVFIIAGQHALPPA